MGKGSIFDSLTSKLLRAHDVAIDAVSADEIDDVEKRFDELEKMISNGNDSVDAMINAELSKYAKKRLNYDDGLLVLSFHIFDRAAHINIGQRQNEDAVATAILDEIVGLENLRLHAIGPESDIDLAITASEFVDSKGVKAFKAGDYDMIREFVRLGNFDLNAARRKAGMEV